MNLVYQINLQCINNSLIWTYFIISIIIFEHLLLLHFFLVIFCYFHHWGHFPEMVDDNCALWMINLIKWPLYWSSHFITYASIFCFTTIFNLSLMLCSTLATQLCPTFFWRGMWNYLFVLISASSFLSYLTAKTFRHKSVQSKLKVTPHSQQCCQIVQ